MMPFGIKTDFIIINNFGCPPANFFNSPFIFASPRTDVIALKRLTDKDNQSIKQVAIILHGNCAANVPAQAL